MRLATPLLAAAILSAFPAAAALPADGRPSVAVLELEAAGASPSLAAAAGAAVGTELDRLAAFRVMTADAIRGTLALQRRQQMLGCSDPSCFAGLGSALGTEYVVSGRVAKLEGERGVPRYTLDLTLSSTKAGKREGGAVESAATEAALIQAVPRAVARMAQGLLAARSGRLALTATEAGATVKVDGQARGTTPLAGMLVVPGGVHEVTVEKDGFVAWRKDVAIPPSGLADESVVLVPSPDFVKRWEARNRAIRTGAWVATGAAAAGVATFVAFQLRASSTYGSPNTPGTFEYYRAMLNAGVTTSPSGEDVRARATALRNRMQTEERISYVGAGVALAGAGTATWLWIVGERPDKYGRFREPARVGLVPTPDGAQAVLAGRF